MLKWTLTAMTVLALPSFAGIEGPTRKVNRLTIDGSKHGGEGSWLVSAPTLQAPSGYLAYDASGKSPQVTFREAKGNGTSWSFVETVPFSDYKQLGMRGGWYVSEQQSGYTMKVQATSGPFQGWYLGRVDGQLVLVKDRRKAATLRMLQTTRESKGR